MILKGSVVIVMIVLRVLSYTQALYTHAVIYMIEIKFLKHDFERQCIWSVQHEVCNKIFWKENA